MIHLVNYLRNGISIQSKKKKTGLIRQYNIKKIIINLYIINLYIIIAGYFLTFFLKKVGN